MIYFGVVEDRSSDPVRACRYKVRVIGVHSPLLGDIPTSDLPWATPIQNESAAMSGVGRSANEYLNGTTVAIVFVDADKQIPLILGAVGGVNADEISGSMLFKSIQDDLDIIPPNAPKEDLVVASDGSTKLKSEVSVIPETSAIVEQGYIGTITATEVKRLISLVASLRSQYNKISTVFGIGTYQFSTDDLMRLGYVDVNGEWTGLNGIKSADQLMESDGLQYDSEELLLKINYTDLNKLGIASAETPKEKLAGFLIAAQVQGTKAVYDLVDSGYDSVNAIGESCFTFYKEGYKTIAGKPTEELPNRANISNEASDKNETNTDPLKSKYDVKHVEKDESNHGFVDPDGKYPLKDRKSEPDTPRLATGYRINSTIVGLKETTLITKVPVANSSSTWKQSPVPYNALYPYNHVYQSESGHVMEFDDTPGSERINLHHKSGTFAETDDKGNHVNRTVGIRTIIVDKDELVYIKGSGHVTIDGDMSLKISKALNVEISGNANIKVGGNCNNEVAGEYNIKVGGNFNLDAAQIWLNSGKSVGVDTFSPTIEIPAPITRKEVQAIEMEETTMADILSKAKPTAKPVSTKEDASQPKTDLTAAKSVNELPNQITYQTQLSTNYKLRDLCVGSLGSNFPFGGQHNLTDVEIAQNLKDLCLNCIEPIRAKFIQKGFKLNSAIRPAGNPNSIPGRISQHELGQAGDLSFSRVRGQPNDREQFYDIAMWIRDNILFDQLLLEYRDEGRQVWIHISFNSKGNRRKVLTMNNDRTYKEGLALIA